MAEEITPKRKLKKRILILLAIVFLLLLLLGVMAWYFAPPVTHSSKEAVVVLKSRYYYELSDGRNALYFSALDSAGVSNLALTSTDAADSLICGGFYVDENGTIATSSRIQKYGDTDKERIAAALKKERERLARDVASLTALVRSKDTYLGSHIAEDKGYAEMVAFYDRADSLLQTRGQQQTRLDTLAGKGTLTLHNEVLVISGRPTFYEMEKPLPVDVLVQGNGVSIVRLKSRKTPDSNIHLRLPWIDWLGHKTQANNVPLHSIVYLAPILPAQWEKDLRVPPNMFKSAEFFQFDEVSGFLYKSSENQFTTTIPLLAQMEGFPIFDRFGRVVGIIVGQSEKAPYTIRGMKASVIRKLL